MIGCGRVFLFFHGCGEAGAPISTCQALLRYGDQFIAVDGEQSVIVQAEYKRRKSSGSAFISVRCLAETLCQSGGEQPLEDAAGRRSGGSAEDARARAPFLKSACSAGTASR